MPAHNGKGPMNQGPKTGRNMGNCEGAKPVDTNTGRCCGRAKGLGRFFGRNRLVNNTDK